MALNLCFSIYSLISLFISLMVSKRILNYNSLMIDIIWWCLTSDKVKQKHEYFTHFSHHWGLMSVRQIQNKSNQFVLCKQSVIQVIPFSHSICYPENWVWIMLKSVYKIHIKMYHKYKATWGQFYKFHIVFFCNT